MIGLYILFFALGVITFTVTAKFGLPVRTGIAVAVFIVPSILVTLWFLKVGDKPPADATTVYPETKIENPKEEKKDK